MAITLVGMLQLVLQGAFTNLATNSDASICVLSGEVLVSVGRFVLCSGVSCSARATLNRGQAGSAICVLLFLKCLDFARPWFLRNDVVDLLLHTAISRFPSKGVNTVYRIVFNEAVEVPTSNFSDRIPIEPSSEWWNVISIAVIIETCFGVKGEL